MTNTQPIRLLKLREVQTRYPVSKSKLYAAIQAGTFPPSVPLTASGRSVGWIESEVSAAIEAIVTGSRATRPAPKGVSAQI